MKKIWIRLLADYDGHKKGDLLEVEEAVGRALITGTIAEDGGKGPERTLGELVTAELDNVRAAYKAHIDGVVEDMRGVTERLQAPRVEAGVSEDEKLARGGQFRSLGHFATMQRDAFKPGGPDTSAAKEIARYSEAADKVTRAVSGLSEGSDPEAGILVPSDSTNEIWDRVREEEESPINLARTFTVSGNRLPIPAVDESSRANGSRYGGLQGFWEGEADLIGKSKPKFREMDLRLKKLAALVYVSSELQSDARGLDSFLSQSVPEELRFKINDAMFSGDGVGKPLGAFKAGCFLGVTKKSGQTAATLVTENILAIWARTYARSRRAARWYYNQDIEPQLGILALPTGSSSGQLTYTPPGGISGTPYATLMGRPAVASEFAETLGTVGDIALMDWSQYAVIMKGGVNAAVSMHLRFDYDELAYRWTIRMDGQPFWNKPLTPYKGTATQSPFVGVETRA